MNKEIYEVEYVSPYYWRHTERLSGWSDSIHRKLKVADTWICFVRYTSNGCLRVHPGWRVETCYVPNKEAGLGAAFEDMLERGEYSIFNLNDPKNKDIATMLREMVSWGIDDHEELPGEHPLFMYWLPKKGQDNARLVRDVIRGLENLESRYSPKDGS